MTSSSLLNSSYKNKAVYNTLEVNNLLINKTSIINNIPFAGKLYEIVAPTNDKYQYKFSEDGTYYDLIVVAPTGESIIALPNVKIVKSEYLPRTYYSQMTYQTLPRTQLILRYVMTGMQFNEDYTTINTDKTIGGPYFQYNSGSLNIVIGGYTENKDLAEQMIKEGKLIFVPDMFPTLFHLVETD